MEGGLGWGARRESGGGTSPHIQLHPRRGMTVGACLPRKPKTLVFFSSQTPQNPSSFMGGHGSGAGMWLGMRGDQAGEEGTTKRTKLTPPLLHPQSHHPSCSRPRLGNSTGMYPAYPIHHSNHHPI